MRCTSLLTVLLASAFACSHPQSPHGDQGKATAPAVAPEFVTRFDAAAGELPEGLAVAAGAAFVGFAPSSVVVRVELESGVRKAFGRLPAPVPGKGFMTGLALSATGDVYAGLASFAPEVQAGIYRIDRAGGEARLFASDAALPFPNALAFDDAGNLWVTDSGTGSIFRIDPQGHAERWATGDLLRGKLYNCGPGLGATFEIGANGIVVEPDAVYIVNNDKAMLVKVPRLASGQADAAVIAAGPDCDHLGGADGLTRAPDGAFLVALNRQNKLTRVDPDGSFETFASGTPLDFPASLVSQGRALYVTNFALYNAMGGKPATPGLLRLQTPTP